MGSVYLDSCAIIGAIEKQTPEGQAIADLVVECADDARPFITSDLTLLEVLVVPIRGLVDRPPDAEGPLRRSYHDWYQANLVPDGLLIQTRPVTRDILIQAALVRARVRSIKTPDAIHVATAYRHGCSRFVTGDIELSKKLEADPDWLNSEKRITFVDLSVAALNALKAELLS
jgi:predicted nucleic acid-binding protein